MTDVPRRDGGPSGDAARPPVATMLTTIREAERAMARRITEAEAAAETRFAEAQAAAEATIDEARRRGADRAESHHRQRLATAKEEAGRIGREGRLEADRLLGSLRPRLTELLDDMVALVLEVPTEEDRCSST
ncbi:MAG: hypothetical protein OER95_08535 [Acidimicrobiia bacterium]|nr:hypothetical protein [Acidimicrobiia bacterium]